MKPATAVPRLWVKELKHGVRDYLPQKFRPLYATKSPGSISSPLKLPQVHNILQCEQCFQRLKSRLAGRAQGRPIS